MWVIGSSFVWLPLLAFIFRGALVGTLGWFTLILILYWVPAFVVLNGVLAAVWAARWYGGAARSKAARTCTGLWWFFAALVVATPGDFTDVDDQGNPLGDLVERLVPVLGGRADSGLAIAAFFSSVAVVWLAVTVWVVVQQTSRVPGPASTPGPGPNAGPGSAPGPGPNAGPASIPGPGPNAGPGSNPGAGPASNPGPNRGPTPGPGSPPPVV